MLRFPFAAALMALAFSSAASAQQKLTDYSVQTSGDYTTRGGDQIYGKIAVGGNVNANADRLGTHLTASDRKTSTLIVGGNLNYGNSTLYYGDVVYGGKNNSPKYNPVSTLNGNIHRDPNLAFDTMSAAAATLSTMLGGLDSNGVFASQWGTGTLTATNVGLNVFSMTGAQFNGLYQLNFIGKSGDVAIINVTGSISDHVNFNLGNFDVGSVLFNFVDAAQVQSNGIDWQGSILAPNALVSLEGGMVRGSIVSRAFQAAGATVQGNAFSHVPNMANAVPEPATWAMMIAGFGLAGLAIRRRRRAMNSVSA